MKKLAIAMMMGIAAMSASAQVNYKMQVACNPQDVKTYNTNRLRSSFLMEKVMVPDQINVTYSMYDRLIFGGAVPATKELVLETIDPLKAKYFLERRELGVINIGGEGIVTVDGKGIYAELQRCIVCRQRQAESYFQEQRCQQTCKILYQLRYCPQGVQNSVDHHRRTQRFSESKFFRGRKDGRKQRPRYQPADC